MPVYTSHPFAPPQYQQPQYYMTNQPPIIKNYTIDVTGPVTNHGKLNMIFEDVLPSTQFSNTSNTIGERLNIYQFIRSVFVKSHDGENIKLEGDGDNSLLSYLKFMELNPYNTNQFSNNPYKGLPDDMLIYRSCYPIRFDKSSLSINCAKSSLGMNIRIYRLTYGEYNVKQNETKNYYDYNVWRELAYYEFIREQIIKQNVCPNFPVMFAYFICENCNIDFNKIANIKGKNRKTEPKYMTKDLGTVQVGHIKGGKNNIVEVVL
jgi:hypothetical protein